MAGAVEELVGDDEVGGLVLFLERADGGDGDDALDAELLQAVDVGAEVELGGEDAVSAAVAGEESDFAAFERHRGHKASQGSPKGVESVFLDVGEAGHGVKPAASDDSDLRLQR